MAFSIRDTFRSSSKLSGANLIGGAFTAMANLVVARRLGPAALGIVGFIQLWLLYAAFARPGFMMAAYREILHLYGQGREEEAVRVQDVALTGEVIFLAIPVSVMLIAGAFQSQPQLRIGLWIAAGTFLTTSLYQLADTIQWTHRRFSLIARVTLLQQLCQPLFLLVGVYTAGLYGVLLAPCGATLAALLYYLFRTAGIRSTPQWDAREIRRLAIVGLPLVLNGFLYWGFRTSDRALVAGMLPITELGYFTFAMSFITQGCQLISNFVNVLQTSLFTELGRLGKLRPLSLRITRISLLILLATGAASGVAEIAFYPLVRLVAPKFLSGVSVFEVLSLNLVCTSAPIVAITVLLSALLNRQHACNILYALGLGLNVLLGWFLTLKGWGLVGIAWSSAISQLAVAASAYALLHPYLFEDAPIEEMVRFYAWVATLVAAALGVHFMMRFGPLSYTNPGDWLPKAGMKVALLAVVWSVTAGALYKTWWGPAVLEKSLERQSTPAAP